MSKSAKELAKELNFSAATVSMVLNNKPGISEATRRVVLDAAKKYGLSGRQNDKQEPDTIHFIIYKKYGDIVTDTPFFAQLTEGITGQCRQNNCLLQISYFYENEDVEEQMASIASVNSSGLLLLGTEMDPKGFSHFKDLAIPIVLLDCYSDELNVDSVLINNSQGAFLAASHLIEQGHKSIGYLKSKSRIANFSERSDGYYKALRRHGLATEHPYVIELSPTAQQGYLDMKAALEKQPPLPSACFADNDIIAAAALRALTENGLRIPEDISVIGFDDMPICQFTEPRLSTMDVPKKKLGALAVSRLVEKLRNQDTSVVKISLSASLVRRDSVRRLS